MVSINLNLFCVRSPNMGPVNNHTFVALNLRLYRTIGYTKEIIKLNNGK